MCHFQFISIKRSQKSTQKEAKISTKYIKTKFPFQQLVPLEISGDVCSDGLQLCFRIYAFVFTLPQSGFFNTEELSVRYESHVKVTLSFLLEPDMQS